MRWGVVVLAFVLGPAAGCGFHRDGDDAGSGGDACVSFATQFGLDTCQLSFDGELMVTGTATYNTTSHVLMIGGATASANIATITLAAVEVDVISARTVLLTSGAHLRATGSRPLVIAASDSITVDQDSLIDVGDGGAGAATSCANGAMVGDPNPSGGGGGGGGGYGADGGDGGRGNSGAPVAMGGPKGHAVGTLPTSLRGGCPGAPGGAGSGPSSGGAPGLGGGALYIVAADHISLGGNTTVTAGGGGGGGGHHDSSGNDAGGGGGGSGGMIILEAPHLLGPSSRIAANGGGGGEGSSGTQPGGAGASGSYTTSRASGGSSMSDLGTDGGDGGSAEEATGESVTGLLAGGGGGGGGGVGFIHLVSSNRQLGPISPPAQ